MWHLTFSKILLQKVVSLPNATIIKKVKGRAPTTIRISIPNTVHFIREQLAKHHTYYCWKEIVRIMDTPNWSLPNTKTTQASFICSPNGTSVIGFLWVKHLQQLNFV